MTPPTALERCPTCDREGCAVAAAAALVASLTIPVTPGENGCACYGEFSRSHNPSRGCEIHGTDGSAALEAAWSAERAAREDCHAHRVDWRARAIAAEAERSEIVSLVSPSSDQSLPDAVRELCEHVEDLRDDAQQWRNAVAGSQEPGDPVIRAIAALLACTYLDKLPTPPDDDFRRELAVAARIAHDKRRTAAAQWAKVAPLIERLRAEYSKRDVTDHDELAMIVDNFLAATEDVP